MAVEPRVTRVAAYAVCVDEADRMLLCRIAQGATRDRDGWWTLPGGGIDHREHPRDAVLRELSEETGLTGEVVELLDVDSWSRTLPAWGEMAASDFHAIGILYRVRVTGGTLRPEEGGTTDEARWFTLEEARRARIVDIVELALERIGRRPVD
ncbi:MAG: NUDIX domain-containing protein [Chloroflexota bacterium]